MKDYRDADLDFLTPGERATVNRAITEFRELTASLPSGVLPSAEQVEQGYTLIGQVNNILAPHFGEEPDLRRMADATRGIQWPEYVLWSDVRLGNDSTGDPAAWIWLVLKDDVEIESGEVQDELARLREAYRNALQRGGIDRWPYISVRTRSEAIATGRGPGLIGGRV